MYYKNNESEEEKEEKNKEEEDSESESKKKGQRVFIYPDRTQKSNQISFIWCEQNIRSKNRQYTTKNRQNKNT